MPNEAKSESEEDRRRHQLRRYSNRVTLGVALGCCVVFLAALWILRPELERVWTGARFFEVDHDVCLRSGTVEPPIASGRRFEFCTEWIDLKDNTGRIHTLDIAKVEIRRKQNGEYEALLPSRFNVQLVLFLILVGVIIYGGKRIQSTMISRYRDRMGFDLQ